MSRTLAIALVVASFATGILLGPFFDVWGKVAGPAPVSGSALTEADDARGAELAAVLRELRELAARLGKTEAPQRVPVEGDSLVAVADRLAALEGRIDQLTRALQSVPGNSAMEFDPTVAPPRSATSGLISGTILGSAEELDKDLQLQTMKEVLMRFGRPDYVNPQGDGGVLWSWQEPEVRLRIWFSWGRVVSVSAKKKS